jgi:hypothetical protein
MAREKLGRNDPCWCQSGKKYKKCHLDRESDSPRPYYEFAKNFNSLRKGDRRCLYPVVSGSCTAPTIEAHSISRNAALLKIAKNGHVYQIVPDSFQIAKERGKIKHSLVGIGRATTFTGFCSPHDFCLFKEIDNEVLIPTAKQVFLLHYRALCKELYAKRPMLVAHDALKDVDRGKSIEIQASLQDLLRRSGDAMSRSIEELEDDKDICDRSLLSEDFSQLRGCIIEFSGVPTMACSGLTQPVYDFSADHLQNLADLNSPMARLSFTLLPNAEGGIAAFIWIDRHDTVCRRFAESFVRLPDNRKCDAIVQFVIDAFENHVVNPDWWESLSSEQRIDLDKRVENWTALSKINDSALVPSAQRFADWRYCKYRWV